MLGRWDISGARNSVRYVTYLITYQKLGISCSFWTGGAIFMGDARPSGFQSNILSSTLHWASDRRTRH